MELITFSAPSISPDLCIPGSNATDRKRNGQRSGSLPPGIAERRPEGGRIVNIYAQGDEGQAYPEAVFYEQVVEFHVL